jgi:hypothetical protein
LGEYIRSLLKKLVYIISLNLFPLIVVLLVAFIQPVSRDIIKQTDRRLIASNGDSINFYQFALTTGNKFVYTIATKGGLKGKIENYKGSFTYSSDTLYLKFLDKQPNNIANYLILEASGHYLIQYFISNKNRIFLRVQSRPLF